MALPKQKARGAAIAYLSRKQAIKKLQLSLKDFRRLCILKGIYPVEPRHKKKPNKNNSTNKTYYHLKDVQFLMHEPLIAKFRAFKVFIRRLKKSIGKQDHDATKRVRENQPTFKLDHIVKERYPTFIDALRDIDDAISMCYLFSTFPKSKIVKPELIHLCRRLTVEFLHYVIESRSLRKVFISIKGYYYQAEIMGQLITWIVPHNLGYARPEDVDFKIMLTFTEFYSTMLGFINYKLFNTLNIVYPPKLQEEVKIQNQEELDDGAVEYIESLNHSLKTSLDNAFEDEVQLDEFYEAEDADDIKDAKKVAEKKEKLKKLFENCKFFLNREVPRESLIFIIRCFGGVVSFDKTVFVGATFEENDESITHQIVDRPMSAKQYLNRIYVQPQWIYDSVNASMLLPVEMYFPGEQLPPHLSPFVEETEGDYIPPEKQALLDMQNGISKGLRTVESESESEQEASGAEEESDVEEEEVSEEVHKEAVKSKKDLKMKVASGVLEKTDAEKLSQRQAAEDKRLAIMMMRKKDKHLYQKIIFGQKRKSREGLKLKEKREEYDRSQKRRKINARS